MRILHMLKSSAFSGAENVACQIISQFSEGNTVAYCSPDGDIADALRSRGVTFLPMKKPSFSEARRVIGEFKPDIIHAHDMGASLYAAMGCKKIPLILHIHNNCYDARGISVKSLAFLPAAKKASHIFWVSKSSLEGYRFGKMFYDKSSVLYNVIDGDAVRQKAGEGERYDILYVGRLTYQKHPERLLDIVSLVKKNIPDVRVAIAGTGELFDSVKAYCSELGLDENVDFLGFVKNPHSLMKNAGVMLMSSRWEGTPICALEAQALGLPVVSTAADGLVDMIENGVNGYLEEDDDTIAKRVTDILTDSALRKKLGDNSERLSRERNDINAYKKKIEAEYEKSICNNNNVRRR